MDSLDKLWSAWVSFFVPFEVASVIEFSPTLVALIVFCASVDSPVGRHVDSLVHLNVAGRALEVTEQEVPIQVGFQVLFVPGLSSALVASKFGRYSVFGSGALVTFHGRSLGKV